MGAVDPSLISSEPVPEITKTLSLIGEHVDNWDDDYVDKSNGKYSTLKSTAETQLTESVQKVAVLHSV